MSNSLTLIGIAEMVVCADGGANWLKASSDVIPDAIVGDLDSIDSDVKAWYKANGANIVDLSHDQDSTDFMKALKYIKECFKIPTSPTDTGCPQIGVDKNGLTPPAVFICGGLEGRVDHAFSQIHNLVRVATHDSIWGRPIYLVNDTSITFVLHEGKNISDI